MELQKIQYKLVLEVQASYRHYGAAALGKVGPGSSEAPEPAHPGSPEAQGIACPGRLVLDS